MKEYAFIQDGKACEIYTPNPPRHWYNYLWNEDRYCMQVSQTGHGKSYYLDEKANMCMLNRDGARYVYLRDEESKEVWDIGQGLVRQPSDTYACVHAIGYSELRSSHNGLSASWRMFVPKKGFHEVWTLTLKNDSDAEKTISVFSAVSFYLEGFSYPRYYEMYRCMTTRFDRELNGVYCESKHPFAPHARYNGFLASSEPVYAYDGDLNVFCGTNSTLTQPDASTAALFQRPDTVFSGRDCSGSEAALFILGGVLQHKYTLRAGETKRFHLFFGVSESLEEARKTVADAAPDKECEEASKAYAEKYSTLSVHTPDKKINAVMNEWVKKQADFCIVGKKGVRDNLQIAAALLDYRQDKAREEILECLRHQFSDGHGVLTWYPYDDTRYSDQPFWIVWAVCRLVREMGDFSVLDERIEWQDGGSASVKEHLQAAVRRLAEDKGPHGLCRLFFADWNDALNVTTDENAESVMLSHQFCLALRDLAELMERAGDAAYAKALREEFAAMKEAINRFAWDGGWYARALTKDGAVGAQDSEGSKIYINAQTWAVLGDVVPEERLAQVLRAVDGMEHDFGFPLNLPPYAAYTPQVGRMSGMLPGLFENGGVYCHATGFKILMDCRTGRADKALATLKKIMPDSELNPSSRSGAEPYVFTNCYSTNPGYYGKSYQSWTTGTSAWCLMGLYEGIMGVQAAYDGLAVRPCFPSAWERAEVTRHFRGADYHIVIENPKHMENGTAEVFVDGRQTEGCVVPAFGDGAVHEVVVKLG